MNPNGERVFRQADADELHAVTGAIFGTWQRDPEHGNDIRVPGVLERLGRIENAIRRSIAIAAGVGGAVGTIVGAILEHVIETALRLHY